MDRYQGQLRRQNDGRCYPCQRQRYLRWLEIAGRWGLAGVFFAAGMPKLFDVHGFAKIIAAYGVLPEILLLPVAIVLPVIEILLASGLLANHHGSKIGIALLLVLFIALLGHVAGQGLDIDCGCFGPEDPEYTAFHGARAALWRDVLLCVPLIYSFWYRWYQEKLA